MSDNIPLFDSLAHPTPDGNWLGSKAAGRNSFGQYLREAEEANCRWALCVGLGGVGGYDEGSYAELVRATSPHFYPVAYFDFGGDLGERELERRFRRMKDSGYVGIKIHPRIAQVQLDHPRLVPAIQLAAEAGLAVVLCTHFYSAGAEAYRNNLTALSRLLGELGDPKLMLAHAGTVRLLEVMEIARPYPRVLLDLSETLCKYEGSSLDLDIQFMFRKFDRRICVGSDSPEYSILDVRRRFEEFARGLDPEKAVNVAHRNLRNFLGGVTSPAG
ncbi:MAG: amidohydrolase family protein [Acidobacteria bacterium]|nr:amidohydrolase family protein [Acidobacteriota bacterium]